MIELNESNFEEEISKGIVVVDFYAPWCGPCKIVGNILEKLSKEYTDVKFFKINVDENWKIAQDYDVTSIPVLLFLKDGILASRHTGVMPEAGIKKMIELMKTKPE